MKSGKKEVVQKKSYNTSTGGTISGTMALPCGFGLGQCSHGTVGGMNRSAPEWSSKPNDEYLERFPFPRENEKDESTRSVAEPSPSNVYVNTLLPFRHNKHGPCYALLLRWQRTFPNYLKHFPLRKMVVVRRVHPFIPHENDIMSTLNIDPTTENAIQMTPYTHQVGGHVGIYALDDQHLCKPYNEHEAEFYRNMPTELREITAACCFEVEVECVGAFGGEFHVIAQNSESLHQHDCGNQMMVSSNARNDSIDTYRDVPSGLANALNPWAFQCQVKSLQNGAHGSYLVLENLTANYRKPCIVDFKLGVRQYGDDASEAKKKSQQKKCAKTTSKSLGLRLCGMQFYDAQSSTYQCVDKYYGRELDRRGLTKMINKFLHADSPVGVRLATLLLEKLQVIRSRVESVDGLRLYGSSLLVVFEGDPKATDLNLDCRLIDFANATCSLMNGAQHAGSDVGTLLGLDSLINITKNLLVKT
uniref:Kinase n=1 Tax=Panagrellus redivivus TaxID=6233 RepID=A0A7E4UW97_PANRE